SRPAGVASARAAASYWGAADGTPDAGQDPFVAANQAYRAAVQPGGDWQTVVSRLDRVIEQYADVLRSHPGHPDAAYNYEFVVRYRAAVAARRQNVPPAGTDEPPSSMHGLEGAPPPEGGGKQFRMLVPMLPDERREAEEAARGGRRIRKG
ncbi:MAG TPA: hypothetical protein VLD67_16440, partial [Vicinamibacterales bacterium]|nr:hypothetical protein [Vicinamibacterales bacterium]